jgi:hypothetical protein
VSQVFGYKEICEGKTTSVFRGQPIVYIHQSIFDQCLVDEDREKHLKWAKEHGVELRDTILNKFNDPTFWSQENEESFKRKLDDYKMIWARRSKIPAMGMVQNIRSFHETLREMKDDIDSDAMKRNISTQDCCESYAYSRSYDFEIFLASRKLDGSPLFEEEEFNLLGEVELAILRNDYSSKVLKFNEEYLELLVVSSFFYSIFDNYVSNPGDFFKKPAPELTVYQMNLLRLAKRYNEVIKIAWEAPEDFYKEPKMLETYAIVKNNAPPDEKELSGSEVEADLAQSKKNRN